MTAKELLREMIAWVSEPIDSVFQGDTVKAGDPDKTVRKVAVTMTATMDVIRRAAEEGADVLIVHEPTFYNNDDRVREDVVSQKKAALIAESGLTVVRFHDHAHHMLPDLICEGELNELGLSGDFEATSHFGVSRYTLHQPITARQLAERLEKVLGVRRVRMVGDPNATGNRVLCAFGTPAYTNDDFLSSDFMLVGEICEWGFGEFARDAGEVLGKAVLVMSHIGSERAGMKLLAEKLRKVHPELQISYIETDELYHYTDD